MLGRPDLDGHRVAAGDRDRLGARQQRFLRSVVLVTVPGDFLQVQVGDIRPQIGEAPRDLRVVPDDDAGQTREAVPGQVERAIRGHHLAAQPHLIPDRRHHRAEVRIVREDRFAGGGVLSGDHPGVGADLAPGRTEQLGHARERTAQPGEGGGQGRPGRRFAQAGRGSGRGRDILRGDILRGDVCRCPACRRDFGGRLRRPGEDGRVRRIRE